jgi:hypothetical protein
MCSPACSRSGFNMSAVSPETRANLSAAIPRPACPYCSRKDACPVAEPDCPFTGAHGAPPTAAGKTVSYMTAACAGWANAVVWCLRFDAAQVARASSSASASCGSRGVS